MIDAAAATTLLTDLAADTDKLIADLDAAITESREAGTEVAVLVRTINELSAHAQKLHQASGQPAGDPSPDEPAATESTTEPTE